MGSGGCHCARALQVGEHSEASRVIPIEDGFSGMVSEYSRRSPLRINSLRFDKSHFITLNYTTFHNNYKLLRRVVCRGKRQ